MRVAMAPYSITLLCMVLRGLQLLCGLVAMITALKAFPMSTTSDDKYRLSAESTFVLIVAYTIVEYAGVFLAVVELFPIVLRPHANITRVTDSLFTIVALTSGIVLATSDYVQHCDAYTSLVHCSNLTASSVFVLLCAAPLIGSILLTFVVAEDPRLPVDECRNRAGSYRMVTTPIENTTLSAVDNGSIMNA